MAVGFLEDVQLWSFNGVEFARRLDATSDWDQWFETDTILSIEPILDTEDRFVDEGGTTIGPMDILAAFETVEERAAFAAMRGQSGSLSNTSGDSRTAVLRKVRKVASGTPNYHLLTCTFEAT